MKVYAIMHFNTNRLNRKMHSLDSLKFKSAISIGFIRTMS